MNSRASGFDERYPIVLGAWLTQFMIIGLLFSYGLFFKFFEEEFGWSRTLLSACTSISFLTMGLLAAFGGRLNDRFGPRPVLAFTGFMCGLGYALMPSVSQPWQLFALFGVFVGLGMTTHDVVTLSTIARWFHKRRGVMTGFVKVGTAAGQIAVPPIAALLIAGYGWRSALTMIGIFAIGLLILAAILMKRPPQGDVAAQQVGSSGFSFSEALRTRNLWMLCAIQFLFFPPLMTIPLHIVVHGMDSGMSTGAAAGLLSTIGGASIAGRMLIGTVIDRIGARKSMILCFLPLIASLLGFLVLHTPVELYAAVVVYGLGHGGFFTIVSPTVAEHFGLKSHGALFGFIVFFGTIGGAAGPVLAGRIFDMTQSYDLAFVMLTVLAVLGLVLALLLPAPRLAASYIVENGSR